jgi:Phosphate-induced protein 1 conserved region
VNHRMNRALSNKLLRIVAPALLPLLAVACGTASPDAVGVSGQAVTSSALSGHTPVPQGIVSGTYPGYGAPAYQGGPLLTGTVHIRPIFYGTAWQPNYESKMTAMLQQLSSSSYWQVVQGYTDSNGNSPGSLYIDSPEYVTNYPHGKELHSADIATVVQDYITAGSWPIGNTYIYMVFTADDVIVGDPGGGLCTSYMGFHYAANFSWTNLIPATITLQVAYAFIGSPQVCVNEGLAGSNFGDWDSSVNGLVIDVAATTAEHEAAEAVTDPFPFTGQYGWNPEIGDICAWVPGPTTLSGGKYSDLGAGEPYASNRVGYSMDQGNTWLLQTIWDKNQNGCAYGPVADDAITQSAACGSWECGTASNGIGGTYYCGKGCETGQTCSSAHICAGKPIICHTPEQCCVFGGGVWEGGHCL